MTRNKTILLLITYHLLFATYFLTAQTYLETKEFNRIVELYQKKNYKEALKGFKIYLEKYPSSYYLPDVYYYIGILEEDYYSSILAFRNLLVKFPEYKKTDEVLYRLGKLYFLHNNYTEAIRVFELLHKDYPKSDFIYGSNYWLGITHLIKGNTEIAIKYFDKVIKYDKKDKFYIMAMLGKGNAYYERQEYNKAIDIYKEALELDEKNYFPNIYLGLANSYMKEKDYDKAYYYYKKILKEFAGSPEYELALEKIEYIENNRTIFDNIKIDKLFPDKKREADKEKYWSVQLASVKNKRYANNLRIKLKVQGYDSFMKSIETDKGKFYRTLVGKFKNKPDAEKLQKELNHKFKLKGIVVSIEL